MAVVPDAEAGRVAMRKGANLLQLRAPGLAARHLLQECQRLLQLGLPVLVSSRVDVALASGARGVNLPVRDVSVADARQLLGPDLIIGRSVHSLDEARASRGADYLLLGPVFPTPTHPESAGLGIDGLRATVRLGVPVIAIGGMTPARARECLKAGASGYAGITMFR